MHWISVTERLPESGAPVLVCYVKGLQPSALFWSAESVEKMRDDFRRLGFTYWMEVELPV